MQPVRELAKTGALAGSQPSRDFPRCLRFEVNKAHGGIGLVPIVAHDAKEAEEMPIALMHRDEGAEPLMPDEYVLGA